MHWLMKKGIMRILSIPTIVLLTGIIPAWAGEADLKIPNLASVTFLNIEGRTLLLWGIAICIFGFLFGLVQFVSIMRMPVHRAMRDISDILYRNL